MHCTASIPYPINGSKTLSVVQYVCEASDSDVTLFINPDSPTPGTKAIGLNGKRSGPFTEIVNGSDIKANGLKMDGPNGQHFGSTIGSTVSNRQGSEWRQLKVATLNSPIGFSFADIAGRKCSDLIFTHQRITDNESIEDVISWFENVGDPDASVPWKSRDIGTLPTRYLIQAGFFTLPHKLQIIAVPFEAESAADILIFTVPDKATDLETVWQDPESATNLAPDLTVSVREIRVLPADRTGLDRLLLISGNDIAVIRSVNGNAFAQEVRSE